MTQSDWVNLPWLLRLGEASALCGVLDASAHGLYLLKLLRPAWKIKSSGGKNIYYCIAFEPSDDGYLIYQYSLKVLFWIPVAGLGLRE